MPRSDIPLPLAFLRVSTIHRRPFRDDPMTLCLDPNHLRPHLRLVPSMYLTFYPLIILRHLRQIQIRRSTETITHTGNHIPSVQNVRIACRMWFGTSVSTSVMPLQCLHIRELRSFGIVHHFARLIACPFRCHRDHVIDIT